MKDEPLLIVIVFLGVLIVGALLFSGGYRGSNRTAYDDSYRIQSDVYRQPAQVSYAYTTYSTNGTYGTSGSCGNRGGSSYTRSDNFGSYRVCNVPGLGECDELVLVQQNICVTPPYR